MERMRQEVQDCFCEEMSLDLITLRVHVGLRVRIWGGPYSRVCSSGYSSIPAFSGALFGHRAPELIRLPRSVSAQQRQRTLFDVTYVSTAGLV